MKQLLICIIILFHYSSFSQTRSKKEAIKLSQEIYTKLKSGEDFTSMCHKFTEAGQPYKELDCIMEWRPKGYFTNQYDKRAWRLPIGTISKPFETVYGFIIIEVLDRNSEKVKTRYILITYAKE